MKKLFFIIGMRRSGTSILRELMLQHPKIASIEFEPHPLWFAVDMDHFERFKTIPYVQKTLMDFRIKGSGGPWHGAKFALNPGLKALEWKWLPIIFPEAKFIFIIRNRESTFKSYYKQDKDAVRGYLPKNIYNLLYNLVLDSFEKYHAIHTGNSCFVQYDIMLSKTDFALEHIWHLFKLNPLTGLQKFIKKPEF